MHKNLSKALMLCIALLSASISLWGASPIKGVVRVKMQPEVAARISQASVIQPKTAGSPFSIGISSIDASLKQVKGLKMRRVFSCSPDRAAEHAKFGLDLWYEISIDESVDPREAQRILAATPGILKASSRMPMKLLDGSGAIRTAPLAAQAASSMPFNDPRLSAQWHYFNDGSMQGAVAGADINLFNAWQIETGRPEVIVAIIDGGIDVTHEDLADAMWVNQAELNGKPGVDDDGNGYVDDIYGFNFCTMDGEIYKHSHGTHVAGTVAAINNNGIGVAGVAGGDGTPGSGARLMSCQAFDPRSGAPDGDFAAALAYAADMGASIAQCSWGWDVDGYKEEDVLDAVRYFTNAARSNCMTGGLCIFAAGNASTTGNIYPACMDEVVAVAAMTYDLQPASYSNYGEWVDVIAPGGNEDFDTSQGILSTLPDNTYGYMEGTSMAAPHVSGIAALVLSKYGSSTLINETLKQQLVTSVNDFYSVNPSVAGLYGQGYIDACKALQWGDGSAPERVNDLYAIASQDVVQLSWTIPAASDNNVNSHIIYYSESPFDASSLDACKTIVVDTKFNVSGDEFTYEITGLSPLTTYYFAIKAVDRWSNASELSDVISATTNAGPEISLSRTAMTIRTTDGENWTTSSFDISNVGEGMLKWKSYMRTMSSAISPYSASAGIMTHPYSGRIEMLPYRAPESVGSALDSFMQDEYPQQMTSCESLYAFIGDNDQSATNSMAQLFHVDADEYPDGFNLTHVYMLGYYGLAPTIEIHRNAGAINASTLIESIEIASGTDPYYYNIALTEALYFAPGSSFYIVVHFKEFNQRNYPLGLGLSNGSQYASQAYLSNDLGTTWTRLAEALAGSSYESIADQATWAIIAKSLYPDWSQTLELTPCEGQVVSGEAPQTVTLSQNGAKIPNGSYRARIHFDTNESTDSKHTINVNINVDGNEPVVTYNKVVQFGNLLVGQSKTLTIYVTNTGYGAFAGGETFSGIYGDKIASTSEHFSGPAYLQNGIPARSTVPVEVTYAPTSSGSHTAQIIITDCDGHELKINVQGAATDPAVLTVIPADIEVGDLDADCTPVETTFQIRNDGNYPLQFVMPKFTDETIEGITADNAHRFGYNWMSNIYGSDKVAYTGMPEMIGATDITSQFSDYGYFSQPVEIGFQFPFYGKKYEKIYISSFGMLTFEPYAEGTMYSPIDEGSTYLKGLGVISAYGFQCQMGPNSHVEYAKVDGRFVVNFRDVLVSVYANDYTPASFHIALSPNGDIEIAFHDYDPTIVFQEGHNLWVGILDPEMADPLTITSSEMTIEAYFYDDDSEEANRWRHVKSGSTFQILAPKPDMIQKLSVTSAIVAPSETIDITATVAANDDMYAGTTTTLLVIQSNDVKSPTTIVNFNANIVGDLKPVFDLASETVDFGNAFRTSVAKLPVTVQNHGRNTLRLQSVAMENGAFSHDFDTETEIPAGQSKDIIVTMPTDTEGALSDTMTITTDAGTRTVSITGTVVGVPQISLGYAAADETIAYGESKDLPLNIENTGNETLAYSITAGNHIAYSPVYAEGANVQYACVAAIDDPTAKRDWIDIETTGLGAQFNLTYFLSHDIVPVDLPFDFYFYGKKYNKMYVYDSGFVSFTKRDDDGGMWPEPPAEFPEGTLYNNLIAPFWGLHSMDITSTSGIFHYETDEMAVVSFIEYGNSMNIGVDFQLILRKDGSFTFNYKAAKDMAMIFNPFGVAGISDEKNQGIRLPDRYIDFDNSVNFFPIVENKVEPGETVAADIRLLADNLAGTYHSSIVVSTNIPAQPTIEIPVKINITGDPKPIFPEDITVEHVAEYQDTNAADELISSYGVFWYAPFSVKNEGAAAFTISSIDMECPTIDGQKQFSLWWYGTFVDQWSGSEITGWSQYSKDAITVGRNVVKFAVPMSQSDYSYLAWTTPGEYDIKLTFHLSGIEGMTEKVMNIKYIVTEQPVMRVLSDGIHVAVADNDEVRIESFEISNEDGLYPLTYSLRVDASGAGETAPSSISTFDVGKSDFEYNCPSAANFAYNKAQYWPALEGSTSAWNYGTTTTYGTYKAAVGYVGPKDGINISHIYTAMNPVGLDNQDVLVEIYNGDPQVTDEVLVTGSYNLGEITANNSIFLNIRLNRPVFISEGQEFYVVITYPVGQPYPATLVRKQDPLQSNRYLGYWDNYGWFDAAALFNESYGSLGYIMTCLETVEGDAWVKLLDADDEPQSALTGEIKAGEKAEFKVRLDASTAPKDLDNKAVIVIKGNDPKNPLVNLPVRLDKNSAPIIEAPAGTLLVNEGEQLSVAITLTDPEHEAFSASLHDNGQMSRFASVESMDEDGEIVIGEDGLSLSAKASVGSYRTVVVIDAPFASAGDYSFTISAADEKGHEASAIVHYAVAHTNRPPVAVPFDDFTLRHGETTAPIHFDDLFRDPDYDDLTYNLTMSKQDVVRAYIADNCVIFEGISTFASTQVTITATDPYGETAVNSFKITTTKHSGIDDVAVIEGISAYPNPVVNTLHIVSAQSIECSIEIFQNNGALMLSEKAQLSPNAPHAVNVSHLAPGAYVLRISASDSRSLSRLLLKE